MVASRLLTFAHPGTVTMESRMAQGGGDLKEIWHHWVMKGFITDYTDKYAVIR